MRPLDRVDPRWVALLLAPVLLVAGAAQGPTTGAPVVAVRAQVAPTALPQLGVAAVPRPAAAVVPGQARLASRASLSHDGPPTGASPALSPEQRGRAALRALGYDPEGLGYRIRFLPYRGSVLGTTHRRQRLITVHVRRGESELVLRTTIAHELGHALDFTHGTPERRDAYRKVRGLPAGPWFPCDRCDDFSSPAGDFAEVFALWLAGPGDFRSRLVGPPTPDKLRELAPLLSAPRTTSARPASPSPTPSPSPTTDPARGLPVLLDPRPTTAPQPR